MFSAVYFFGPLPGEEVKEKLHDFKLRVVDVVLSGDAKALPTYVTAKMISNTMADIIEAIESSTQDELSRYENGGKNVELFGCKIQNREGTLTPDFSHDTILAELEAQVKARKDLLRSAFKNDGKAFILCPSTGEVIDCPPAKATKSSIAVTL